MKYPAKIVFNENDYCYNVTFPDIKACFTWGESLDEAKEKAEKVLRKYLMSVDTDNVKLPKPSKKNGKNIHYISVKV